MDMSEKRFTRQKQHGETNFFTLFERIPKREYTEIKFLVNLKFLRDHLKCHTLITKKFGHTSVQYLEIYNENILVIC